MAFSFNWENRVDGQDYVMADDVNNLALGINELGDYADTELGKKISTASIVNDLVTGGATVPASAETVKALNSNKVEKVDGKSLSANDFTNEYKAQLDGLNDDLAAKVNTADIVNSLTDGGTEKVLAAEQGKNIWADINFPITNSSINSDFSNGTTGWTTTGATLSVLDNTATLLASTVGGKLLRVISTIINHQYYVKARVKSVSPLVRLDLYDGSSASYLYHSGNGEYEDLSLVRTSVVTSSSGQLQIRDNRTSGWDNVYVQYVISVDLTAAFGAGNEPTAAQMDDILSHYENGWFDGTVNLANNSKMLPYLLVQIRDITAAVVALGGTL